MKPKIYNLKPYTPAEIESFRARMEAEQRRAEEYEDEEIGGRSVVVYVLALLLFTAIGGYLVACWWQASDKLIGLS